MQRNNTSEQLLLWVPLGYQFPFTWVRFGFILIPTRPMLLSFLGLLFQLEFESPSSSYTSSQSKATTKLPGRTLIRPGTGLSRAEKEAILVPPKTQEVFIGMVIGYLEWLTRAEKEAIVVPATIKEHSAVKSAIYYWRNFSMKRKFDLLYYTLCLLLLLYLGVTVPLGNVGVQLLMFLLMVFCIATTLTGSGGKSEFFFLTTITSNFLTPVYLRTQVWVLVLVLNFHIVLILHFLIVLPSCLLITPPSKYRGPHDSISYSLLASGGRPLP